MTFLLFEIEFLVFIIYYTKKFDFVNHKFQFSRFINFTTSKFYDNLYAR